jgi:hypothetical protein
MEGEEGFRLVMTYNLLTIVLSSKILNNFKISTLMEHCWSCKPFLYAAESYIFILTFLKNHTHKQLTVSCCSIISETFLR